MNEKRENCLYLECSSGISGDMTVGALLDLGASREVLERALDSLGIGGYHLHFGRTKKCGIDAFDFDVHLETDGDEQGHEHRDGHIHNHEHGDGPVCEHIHSHEHGDSPVCEHIHSHEHEDASGCEHIHSHEHGDASGHEHTHSHVHRNIRDIFSIIDRLDAEEAVKDLARRMFSIVAEAESKAHGIPVEKVHFHEVGAIDSIVDIISVAVCIYDLGISKVYVSALAEGQGYVRCQHGVMPVPVPATVNIASRHGLSFRFTENQGEMVTPTGAAIAAALRTESALPEYYTIEKIGIGAGTKDFKQANILRAMLIRPQEEEKKGEENPEALWVLETNLDDCTGEALGFAMELLLEAGARDVWYTSAFMKKNRPAYVLHVLCEAEKIREMEEILFSATTTIGIRRCPVKRTALERQTRRIETRYGEAQVKLCRPNGGLRCYPEFESVRAICRETGLGFPEVYAGIAEDGKREVWE